MSKFKKILRIILPILIVILLVTIATLILIIDSKDEETGIKYIAHRGHGYYDNTVEAFYNSGDYWGIECDVRITSDNKLILNHDATVTYDDGSVLAVEESTYANLMSKTLGGGYTICSLQRYLEICDEMSKVAIIELKSYFDTDDVTKLLNEIETYHSIDDSVVISFDKNNLLNVRAQSDISLQYLCSGDESAFDFCIEYDIDISIQYVYVDKNAVRKAHNNGLKIGVWTVNDAVSNFNMKRLHVDYVTSDEFCE